MNKNCKMTIGAMLLLTTAFSAFPANAQTCAVPPTCESLGYDKSADECSGLAQLKCPFDQSISTFSIESALGGGGGRSV